MGRTMVHPSRFLIALGNGRGKGFGVYLVHLHHPLLAEQIEDMCALLSHELLEPLWDDGLEKDMLGALFENTYQKLSEFMGESASIDMHESLGNTELFRAITLLRSQRLDLALITAAEGENKWVFLNKTNANIKALLDVCME